MSGTTICVTIEVVQTMASSTRREKFSISLPETSVVFVEQYRKTYSVKSRSEVIDLGLRALQERELEGAYAEAAAEEASFSDFECADTDGLDDDEAW